MFLHSIKKLSLSSITKLCYSLLPPPLPPSLSLCLSVCLRACVGLPVRLSACVPLSPACCMGVAWVSSWVSALTHQPPHHTYPPTQLPTQHLTHPAYPPTHLPTHPLNPPRLTTHPPGLAGAGGIKQRMLLRTKCVFYHYHLSYKERRMPLRKKYSHSFVVNVHRIKQQRIIVNLHYFLNCRSWRRGNKGGEEQRGPSKEERGPSKEQRGPSNEERGPSI